MSEQISLKEIDGMLENQQVDNQADSNVTEETPNETVTFSLADIDAMLDEGEKKPDYAAAKKASDALNGTGSVAKQPTAKTEQKVEQKEGQQSQTQAQGKKTPDGEFDYERGEQQTYQDPRSGKDVATQTRWGKGVVEVEAPYASAVEDYDTGTTHAITPSGQSISQTSTDSRGKIAVDSETTGTYLGSDNMRAIVGWNFPGSSYSRLNLIPQGGIDWVKRNPNAYKEQLAELQGKSVQDAVGMYNKLAKGMDDLARVNPDSDTMARLYAIQEYVHAKDLGYKDNTDMRKDGQRYIYYNSYNGSPEIKALMDSGQRFRVDDYLTKAKIAVQSHPLKSVVDIQGAIGELFTPQDKALAWVTAMDNWKRGEANSIEKEYQRLLAVPLKQLHDEIVDRAADPSTAEYVFRSMGFGNDIVNAVLWAGRKLTGTSDKQGTLDLLREGNQKAQLDKFADNTFLNGAAGGLTMVANWAPAFASGYATNAVMKGLGMSSGTMARIAGSTMLGRAARGAAFGTVNLPLFTYYDTVFDVFQNPQSGLGDVVSSFFNDETVRHALAEAPTGAVLGPMAVIGEAFGRAVSKGKKYAKYAATTTGFLGESLAFAGSSSIKKWIEQGDLSPEDVWDCTTESVGTLLAMKAGHWGMNGLQGRANTMKNAKGEKVDTEQRKSGADQFGNQGMTELSAFLYNPRQYAKEHGITDSTDMRSTALGKEWESFLSRYQKGEVKDVDANSVATAMWLIDGKAMLKPISYSTELSADGKTVFSYDSMGNLIEERSFKNKEKAEKWQEELRYDAEKYDMAKLEAEAAQRENEMAMQRTLDTMFDEVADQIPSTLANGEPDPNFNVNTRTEIYNIVANTKSALFILNNAKNLPAELESQYRRMVEVGTPFMERFDQLMAANRQEAEMRSNAANDAMLRDEAMKVLDKKPEKRSAEEQQFLETYSQILRGKVNNTPYVGTAMLDGRQVYVKNAPEEMGNVYYQAEDGSVKVLPAEKFSEFSEIEPILNPMDAAREQLESLALQNREAIEAAKKEAQAKAEAEAQANQQEIEKKKKNAPVIDVQQPAQPEPKVDGSETPSPSTETFQETQVETPEQPEQPKEMSAEEHRKVIDEEQKWLDEHQEADPAEREQHRQRKWASERALGLRDENNNEIVPPPIPGAVEQSPSSATANDEVEKGEPLNESETQSPTAQTERKTEELAPATEETPDMEITNEDLLNTTTLTEEDLADPEAGALKRAARRNAERQRDDAVAYSRGEIKDKPENFDYWKNRLGLEEPKAENEMVEAEVEPSADEANSTGFDNVKPIGKGVFGNIYDQFKGKAQAAIDFLRKVKGGVAKSALHHKDVGDIDLWYGDDKAGLKKIASKHPEVLEDLQSVLDKMRVTHSSDNRIILESGTHKAIVSKDWYGKKADNWLLTAYEKKVASGGSIDIVPEPEKGRQNGTAPLQDNLSNDKDSKEIVEKQEKTEKNATQSQERVAKAASLRSRHAQLSEEIKQKQLEYRFMNDRKKQYQARQELNKLYDEIESVEQQLKDTGEPMQVKRFERPAKKERTQHAARKAYDEMRKKYKDDSEVMEILDDTEPQDIYEQIGIALGSSKLLFKSKGEGASRKRGIADETGWKWNDVKGMFQLFDNEKGQSVQNWAETFWADLDEGTKNRYSSTDIANIMLDVLGGASTIGDLRNIVLANRVRQAEELLEHREKEEEYWRDMERHEQEMKDAEEEAMLEQIKDLAENLDWNEINGILADEYVKEEKLKENGDERKRSDSNSSQSERSGVGDGERKSETGRNDNTNDREDKNYSSVERPTGETGADSQEDARASRGLDTQRVSQERAGLSAKEREIVNRVNAGINEAIDDLDAEIRDLEKKGDDDAAEAARLERDMLENSREDMIDDALAGYEDLQGFKNGTRAEKQAAERVEKSLADRKAKRMRELLEKLRDPNTSDAKRRAVVRQLADLGVDASGMLPKDSEQLTVDREQGVANREQRGGSGWKLILTPEETALRDGLVEKMRSAGVEVVTDEAEGQRVLDAVRRANEMLREMRGWHGSGADFDAFDHSHMGEGEGVQAYGWGTYVTEVEGIGRSYARATSRAKATAEYKYRGQELVELSGLERRAVGSVLHELMEYGNNISVDDAIDIAIDTAKESIRYYNEKREKAVERLQQAKNAGQDAQDVADIEAKISIYDEIISDAPKEIEILRGLNPKDFSVESQDPTPILYEVEVPDSLAMIEKENSDYNAQLEAFGHGELAGGIIRFGNPSKILQACGLRGEMMMMAKTLKNHLAKHGLSIDDVRDLPKALRNPLLVYEWGTEHKSTLAITELETRDGRKLTAAIRLGQRHLGDDYAVAIDEIVSIHGKDAKRMLREFIDEKERKVHDGLEETIKYIKDKEKVLEWLGLVPPQGTASLTSQELSVAKVIENFKNAKDAVENIGEYLPFDEPLTDEQLERIALAGRQSKEFAENFDLRNDPLAWAKVNEKSRRGDNVYSTLSNMLGARKASELLSQAGFVGIEYPAQYRSGGRSDGAKNYVIFNEKDIKIVNKTRLFRTEAGEVYGFVKDGKIYLDPKLASSETAVHEYTHLWSEALRKSNPKAWEQLKSELLKDKETLEVVKKLYPELEGDELMDEVFSNFSGKRGAEKLRTEQERLMNEAKDESEKSRIAKVFDHIKRALDKYWNMARDLFAGNNSRLKKMSAEDFADMALNDLLRGFNPKNKAKNVEAATVKDPFYSNAERAVEGIKQNKATAEQWKAMLTKAGGIKAGEDKWMGLSEWLYENRGKSLSKDEVMQFIKDNSIEMEETTYSEAPQSFDSLKREYDQWLHDEGFDYAQEQLRERFGDDADIAFDDLGGELVIANEKAAAALLGSDDIINQTRLDYTTEGLENKREIAFVVPGVEPYQDYDSIHFGPENKGKAVMWVRFGETTDADGKRVLVIDEIQSNRHQDAREEGYISNELSKKLEETEAKISQTENELRELTKAFDTKYGGAKEWHKTIEVKEAWGRNYKLVADEGKLTKEEYSKLNELQEERDSLITQKRQIQEQKAMQDGVPAAPFEKNWHEVAMKRMLRLAAEEGFDKVAWTTGEQQAERYNIGNAVERIEKLDDRAFLVYPKDGSPYQELEFDEDGVYRDDDDALLNNKTMADIFGKGTAEKLKNLSDGDQLTGEGLRIGGEGMKGFYDQILPRFMDKYGKRWGVKTGTVELPFVEKAGRTMHVVDVTPEMKESVMQGQPLFRLSGNEKIRVERDNARFNEEVERLTEKNADATILQLGMPSGILKSVGIADKPMRLYGNKLMSKARKHGFSLSEIKNLPIAISDPIMIFEGSDKGSHSILTELKTASGNVLANIAIGKGNMVDFNIIRSVYGKNEKGITKWILDKKMLYSDKERALDFLNNTAPIAGIERSQELDNVAKIIKEFENPSDLVRENAINKIREAVEAVNGVTGGRAKVVREADLGKDVPKNAQAWYDPNTGEVHVVAERVNGAEDASRAVWHEEIGHKAMSELLGDRYNEWLDDMHKLLGSEHADAMERLREKYAKELEGKSEEAQNRLLADEWIAELAERGEKDLSTWQKVKGMFRNWLWKHFGVMLGDGDIDYMLHKALAERRKGYRSKAMMSIAERRRAEEGNAMAEQSRRYRLLDEETRAEAKSRARDLLEAERNELNDKKTQMEDALNRALTVRRGDPSAENLAMSPKQRRELAASIERLEKRIDALNDSLAETDLTDPERVVNRAWDHVGLATEAEMLMQKAESLIKTKDILRNAGVKSVENLTPEQRKEYDRYLWNGKIADARLTAMRDARPERPFEGSIDDNLGREPQYDDFRHPDLDRDDLSERDRSYLEGKANDDYARAKAAWNRQKEQLIEQLDDYEAECNDWRMRQRDYMREIVDAEKKLRADWQTDYWSAMENNQEADALLHVADMTGIPLTSKHDVQTYLRELRYEHVRRQQHAEGEDYKFIKEIESMVDKVVGTGSLANKVRKHGDRKQVMKDLIDMMEGTKEVTEEMKPIVKKIQQWFDDMFEWQVSSGLVYAPWKYRQGYVPHLWNIDASRPDADAAAKIEKAGGLVPTRMNSPFMNERFYDTYEEGIQHGLVPKHKSIIDLIKEYSKEVNKAVSNRQALDILRFVKAPIETEVWVEQEGGGKEKVTQTQWLPIVIDAGEVPPKGVQYNAYKNSAFYKDGTPQFLILSPRYVKGTERNIYSMFGEQGYVSSKDAADSYLEKALGAADKAGQTVKQTNLSFSAFHAIALTEHMVGASKFSLRSLKRAVYDTIIESVVTGKTLRMRKGDVAEDAMSHFVKLGNSYDFDKSMDVLTKLADVINNPANPEWRKFQEARSAKEREKAAWSLIRTVFGFPLKLVKMLKKGNDFILWDMLHDGYKLSVWDMRSKYLRKQAEKRGWSESRLNRQLDDLGQTINDMFGGQHWELLNASPRAMRNLRLAFLSPDWNISWMRLWGRMGAMGKLRNDNFFRGLKNEKGKLQMPISWKAIKKAWGERGAQNLSTTVMAMSALMAFIGYSLMNLAMRKKDIEEELAKAEAMRDEDGKIAKLKSEHPVIGKFLPEPDPNYKSPYEEEDIKPITWDNFLSRFNEWALSPWNSLNDPGKGTYVYIGKDESGRGRYLRPGKQMRELFELFLDEKDHLDLGAWYKAGLRKMNPLVGVGHEMMTGYSTSGWENKDLTQTYGAERELNRLKYVLLHTMLPMSIIDPVEKGDTDKMWWRMAYPVSKGMGWYKGRELLEDAIRNDDDQMVEHIRRSFVLNGMSADFVSAYSKALGTIRKEEAEEEGYDDKTPDELFKMAAKSNDPKMREKLLEKAKEQIETTGMSEGKTAREAMEEYQQKAQKEGNYLLHCTEQDMEYDTYMKIFMEKAEEDGSVVATFRKMGGKIPKKTKVKKGKKVVDSRIEWTGQDGYTNADCEKFYKEHEDELIAYYRMNMFREGYNARIKEMKDLKGKEADAKMKEIRENRDKWMQYASEYLDTSTWRVKKHKK